MHVTKQGYQRVNMLELIKKITIIQPGKLYNTNISIKKMKMTLEIWLLEPLAVSARIH